jgi:hypothetical protein
MYNKKVVLLVLRESLGSIFEQHDDSVPDLK